MLFEITIKYKSTNVKETVLLNAENYTDAETKTFEYLNKTDSSVKLSIKELSKYKVIVNDSKKATVWYKATVVNACSENGKELTERILYNAENSEAAFDFTEEYAVNNTEYEAARCISLKETNISHFLKDEE